jgi:hypothetical protein
LHIWFLINNTNFQIQCIIFNCRQEHFISFPWCWPLLVYFIIWMRSPHLRLPYFPYF